MKWVSVSLLAFIDAKVWIALRHESRLAANWPVIGGLEGTRPVCDCE